MNFVSPQKHCPDVPPVSWLRRTHCFLVFRAAAVELQENVVVANMMTTITFCSFPAIWLARSIWRRAVSVTFALLLLVKRAKTATLLLKTM